MKEYVIYLIKNILILISVSLLIYLFIPKKYADFSLIFTICLFILFSLHIAQVFSLKKSLQIRHLINLDSKFSIWQEVIYYLLKLQKRYQKRYQDLQNKHEDFMKAIEASPNGVIILDNDGYIKWLNHRVLGLLNISKQDIGQRIQHLIRHPKFVEYWQDMHNKGVEIQNLNNIVHIKILPIDNNNLLFLVQDITERQKVEKMQKDFIANASHEISTPLTSIVGFSETIQNLDLTQEQIKNYLSKIHISAMNLKYLVQDLLTITQIENQINKQEKINLYELCKNLYTQTKQLQTQHKIVWQENILNKDDCIVYSTKSEIISAIQNLINNACKYTPENGDIIIGIKQQGDFITIFVKDNGIGIDSEYLSDLTKRFFRVPNDNNKKIYGTGLGLSIVSQIAQKNNASLDISTKINEGSCFCLSFKHIKI